MPCQQPTTCPQYHRFNESPEPTPFTYSIIVCYSKNRRPVHNITGSMKVRSLLHILTRSSYAFPTIDDLSTISHVKWKNGDYWIHLLDYRMPFQQSTTCPQYHRFNESPESILFTYSIIVCYSNNGRPVHNITGWMNGESLVYSLTRSSYAIVTIDDLSTISHVKWKNETPGFTYSIIVCHSNNRRPVHSITGSMKVQIRLLSLTRSSYAIPRIDDLSTISQVGWTARF
jgi:hypothetical protein